MKVLGSITKMAPHTGIVASIALLATASLIAGCGDPVDAARDQVSTAWMCPPERLQIVRRNDLNGGDLYRKIAARPAPPPDIAADPARKAFFEAQQQKQIEQTAKLYQNATIVEARGCGNEAILACWRKSKKAYSDKHWFYCIHMG